LPKKKAVDVYAVLIDRPRFEKVWAWHRDNICSIAGAEAGDKVAAAWAWKELEETNFYGKGIDGFKKGCALFKTKTIATHGVGVQHVSRFLTGPVKGEPRWLTYLNEAEEPQISGDFLEGVDTDSTQEAIGAELTRLGRTGLLPPDWAKGTNCTTVSELSGKDAARYLAWLRQQEATHAA
jgi:hypothetical protein